MLGSGRSLATGNSRMGGDVEVTLDPRRIAMEFTVHSELPAVGIGHARAWHKNKPGLEPVGAAPDDDELRDEAAVRSMM